MGLTGYQINDICEIMSANWSPLPVQQMQTRARIEDFLDAVIQMCRDGHIVLDDGVNALPLWRIEDWQRRLTDPDVAAQIASARMTLTDAGFLWFLGPR